MAFQPRNRDPETKTFPKFPSLKSLGQLQRPLLMQLIKNGNWKHRDPVYGQAMVQLLRGTHRVNKQSCLQLWFLFPSTAGKRFPVRDAIRSWSQPLLATGNKNTWRREGHQAPHRKGYPQGISGAGSLLSQKQQLDYHNNRTGPGRDDGYCTALYILDGWLEISKLSSITTLERFLLE